MSQISFSDAEYAGKRKKTRREVFLQEMELVVPWKVLLKIIEPHYPTAGRAYPLESMLRVHLMQNWFALSDPAMEEALYEIASLRTFAHLSLNEPIPDETTILNFRHLLEANDLAEDMLKVVNAFAGPQGSAAQARQHRGRHHHCRAQFNQERPGRAGPRDVPDQEGQPVVLRHEGAHRGGCPQRPGAHRHHHTSQRSGCRAGGRPVARQGEAGLGRLRLQRRANARAAGGSAVAHRGQTQRHRQVAKRQGQSEGSEGRTRQGQRAREGGAPVSCHQAPVRAGEGEVPRAGQEHSARGDTVDTNVLVSALLWQGTPGRLIELAGEKEVQLLTSRALPDELAATLAKKKLVRPVAATGLTAAQMLAGYKRIATTVTARQLDARVSRDADDDAALACALAARADFIVTGDDDLLVLQSFQGIEIVSARVAVERLEA